MTEPPPGTTAAARQPLPESVVGWMRSGTIDGPLAACLWLLAEGGVPVLVAAQDPVAGGRLADALDAFGRPPALLAVFPASIEADSLEAVLTRLAAPPYDLTDDAIRSVGVVVVLHQVQEVGLRVAVAHYVRPLEQDPQGHVQRRPPALLAAWDAEGDRFDDYAWGITAELAGRAGRDPAAFERARAERASLLEELAAAGTLGRAAVAQAILAIARERERTH
jgi:hypothetical protein